MRSLLVINRPLQTHEFEPLSLQSRTAHKSKLKKNK
jgi:hypothetical protein